MLPGECNGVGGYTCVGDGDDESHGEIKLKLEVLHSAAGYYLGYTCPKCGPISRESGYFKSRAEADAALPDPTPHLRKPGFNRSGLEILQGLPDEIATDNE